MGEEAFFENRGDVIERVGRECCCRSKRFLKHGKG